MSTAASDDLTRSPHPRLRPFVGDYAGYDISGVPAGTHLGLPSGALTFIVAINQPLQQYFPEADTVESFDVLLAGLHLWPTLIAHNGAMSGIQINFTPFAPRAFFASPAVEFAHHSVELGDIAQPIAAELHERVNTAPTWSQRFDAIDDVLLRAIRDDLGPRAEVVESWRQIARSHGGLPVSLVADEVGWSRRHLNGQFRAEFGIGPKEAARVIRFDRARKIISAGKSPLAEVAAVCGYTDQSHLNRDFRLLTGTSPTGWLDSDPIARRSEPNGAVSFNGTASQTSR
ncbi:helix-turn-helix domain-containing protein [Brevibacterium sp. FME37]|uniref:helix-turn-helix domain-containing protein n=1 Tax=Brevibacterium sp. FME37 TaxID=2742607 RepID=UPI0018686E32|nr:helix-turn-helix transcriptional regulator [Brevibacterium sp. FME37]